MAVAHQASAAIIADLVGVPVDWFEDLRSRKGQSGALVVIMVHGCERFGIDPLELTALKTDIDTAGHAISQVQLMIDLPGR
jgi:hypothetical protein